MRLDIVSTNEIVEYKPLAAPLTGFILSLTHLFCVCVCMCVCVVL